MEKTGPRIYIPETLIQAMLFSSKYDSPAYIAGGTWIMSGVDKRDSDDYPALISLDQILELKKISRTDRYLDLGAGLTINELLKLPSGVLPDVLNQSLRCLGSLPVRNMATIGGAVCCQKQKLDLWPVLTALETRVEIRRLKTSRSGRQSSASQWMLLHQLVLPGGGLDMESEDLLVRFRIPEDHWNGQFFWKTGSPENPAGTRMNICFLGKSDKKFIGDIRIALSDGNQYLFRDRELEAEFIGRRLPLSAREINGLTENFIQHLSLPKDREFLYQILRNQMHFFLEELLL